MILALAPHPRPSTKACPSATLSSSTLSEIVQGGRLEGTPSENQHN